MIILITGMLFNCLKRPNLFLIPLLISSLVHVTDRVVSAMQNMRTFVTFPSKRADWEPKGGKLSQVKGCQIHPYKTTQFICKNPT